MLEAFEVPATVYVHTDAVGTDGRLSDRQRDEPFDHDLLTVGNHTRSHPYLTRIADHERRAAGIDGA